MPSPVAPMGDGPDPTPARPPRLFRLLWLLLPRDFRERHGGEIWGEVTHQVAEAADTRRVWCQATLDLACGLLPAWRRRVSPGFPRGRHGAAATAEIFQMETWIQDVRFGARALWRHANITTLCIVAIALGIGANAAVFTLINEILLRPLPVHEPSRLIDLHVDQPGANSFVGFSYPEFEELRAANALARPCRP